MTNFQNLKLSCGYYIFLIALNKTCEQRRKASKPAPWNNFLKYMIGKTSCELTRVYRNLWSLVMFREFFKFHSLTARANLKAF